MEKVKIRTIGLTLVFCVLRWTPCLAAEHRKRLLRGLWTRSMARFWHVTWMVGATLMIAGCATTEYQALESTRPVTLQGGAGVRIVRQGVDIWTTGVPNRPYRVMGVVTDSRVAGITTMASYWSDVVKKVREARGDAAIQISPSADNVTTAALTGFAGGFGYNYQQHNASFYVIKYL